MNMALYYFFIWSRFPSFQVVGLGQVCSSFLPTLHARYLPSSDSQITAILLLLLVAKLLKIVDFPGPSVEQFKKVRTFLFWGWQNVSQVANNFLSHHPDTTITIVLHCKLNIRTGKHQEVKVGLPLCGCYAVVVVVVVSDWSSLYSPSLPMFTVLRRFTLLFIVAGQITLLEWVSPTLRLLSYHAHCLL